MKRVTVVGLLLGLLMFGCATTPTVSQAVDTGILMRANCDTLNAGGSGNAGKLVCWDIAKKRWRSWRGAAWTDVVGVVSVMDFAPSGSDIGDGTTDASATFAAAIAAVPDKTTILIPRPSSSYKFNSGITINKHVSLVGEAPDITINCAGGITCITMSKADWRGEIRNLLIVNGAKGISFTANMFDVSTLRDLTFYGQTSKAVEFTSTSSLIQNNLTNLSIDAAGGSYGLWIEGEFTAQAAIIENLHCTGAAVECIHIKNTSTNSPQDTLYYGPTLFHPVVEGNGGIGMYIYGVKMSVYDWYSEHNGTVTDGKDIEIDGDPVHQNGVILFNPTFQASSRASYPTTIKMIQHGHISVYSPSVLGRIDANNKILELTAYGLTSAPTVLNASSVNYSLSGSRYKLYNPQKTGAGSTYAHEGDVTISSDTTLGGVHYYKNFTLNAGVTITVDDTIGFYAIFASEIITINGTITAASKGHSTLRTGTTGAGATGFGTTYWGQCGGGGGGGSSTASGGAGGFCKAIHISPQSAAGGGVNTAGSNATQITGNYFAAVVVSNTYVFLGGSGGGSGAGDGSNNGGNGGRPGGGIVLNAPSVYLASTAVLDTSGGAGGNAAGGNAGGGGGGGAGTVFIITDYYADAGATFTQTGGTGGAKSGTGGAGGNGAAGVKQITIH